MKARTVVLATLLALLVPLAAGAALILSVVVSMPTPQGDRVRGPHGLVGVWAGGAYAWVLPVDDDRVVVIDTGGDREASALRTELAGREVVATLLTHGHVDHTAGVDALPDAPLYYSTLEGKLVRGERLPGGYLAAWYARTDGAPRLPEEVHEVADGDELAFGDVRIRVVAVPGHTRGSVAYLWRDVLFAGDAVLGGETLMLAPDAFATDPTAARASLEALVPLAFHWLADGHAGIRGEARSALLELLELDEAPEPTVSMADVDAAPTPATADRGEEQTLTGRYVQTPVPDARGLQPAYLVDARGRRWVLSREPVASHAALRQRQVTVTGHVVSPPLGHRAVGGPWLEVVSIEAVDSAVPGVRRVEVDDLDEADQAWVEVVGPLEELVPLSPGSARAEGRLHGVRLFAPSRARALVGQQATVLARVDGGVLLAEAVCAGDAPGCGRRPTLRGLEPTLR